jgi:endonuclease YncB( thermonuclease family)
MKYRLLILLLTLTTTMFGVTRDTVPPTFTADTAVAPVADPFAGLVPAVVYKVYDGDGCRVKLRDGSIRKIRFYGCDSPEFANAYTTETQYYAKESRDSLRALILNKTVYLDTLVYGKARYTYDRLIANIYTADAKPVWVNELVIMNGWAQYYSAQKDAKPVNEAQPEILQEAQDYAKSLKMGGWKNAKKFTSPAYWRKTHKRTKSTSPKGA